MIRRWWHDKIAYQIYPKSFCDSDGDGIGDLGGIISKLDYLKELGVDILWICPIFKSPFIDQGYDISDYESIAPEFGTMDDFDALLDGLRARGMYLILDLVANHCSSEHPWFQKALADPYGEYGGYFYFRKGKNGGPPSNYRSYFGGSAWEKVPGTELYYLHSFSKEQPDLNWENPRVREEIYAIANRWLDRGVAGFRIDAIMNIKKDPAFPSYEPDSGDGTVHIQTMIGKTDGIGYYLNELNEKVFKPRDAFTVGEVFHADAETLPEFTGDDGYFSTIFDFTPYLVSVAKKKWSDLSDTDFNELRKAVFDSQRLFGKAGFSANIIENHDEPRGSCNYLPRHLMNETGIKMLAAVNILLRGIPFIYQGQEIGMRNCARESIEEYDDIETKNNYRAAIDSGYTKEEALKMCYKKSRDNARTPMQWDATKNAGFTTGKPWLSPNPDYVSVNVRAQEDDPDSVLNFYRRLIRLRKSDEYRELFTYGRLVPAFEDRDGIFAYYRVRNARADDDCVNGRRDPVSSKSGVPKEDVDGHTEEERRVLVAANFGTETTRLTPEYAPKKELLANTHRAKTSGEDILLRLGEVVVMSCGGRARR